MEQPPGSLDDLQPQDLSTATVIDLTRTGDLSATPLDGLRVVKSPGWYPNSGSGDPAFPSSETGATDVTLQSGDQIQPDDAFSHTTVTLSYVSRSHVLAAHDALSRHSHLCGVPPISRFSLRPPCEAEKGLGAANHTNHQHYPEPADGPVDLAAQTKLFHSSSQARVAPEDDGVCLAQRPCESNGGVVSGDGDSEGDVGHSLEAGNGRGLENGEGGGCECAESSAEPLKDDGRRGCEELFLVSQNHEPAVASDKEGTRELYSLGREFRSPLEDPASPSATSLDDVDSVFMLPRASSSPSAADSSLLGTADTVAWEDSSADGVTRQTSGAGAAAAGSDPGDPVHTEQPALEPLIDLTGDVCLTDISEEKAKAVHPHVNGNARVLQRTLPMRSGRGMRLEAIVMNINSSRYKVSGRINTSKKAKASRTANDAGLVNPGQNGDLPQAGRKGKAATAKRRAGTPHKGGKASSAETDICKDSTSDPQLVSSSSKSNDGASAKSPQSAARKRSNVSQHRRRSPQKSKRKGPPAPGPSVTAPEPPSHSELSLGIHSTPATKSPKSSPGSAAVKAAGRKTPAAAKTKAACTPKRRRKKPGPSSSMFSPKEPEIKLKYVNYKERRELRSDSFSPFVRVKRQQSPSPSLCTVVNYPEKARTPHTKKGQQAQGHPGGFVSAVVPNTSCLQLGRPAAGGQHRRSLVCCLCGLSANAMDLGDLHGPYYPEGYQSGAKAPTCKEDKDNYSDSDSSSCSVRHAGRKRAAPPAAWPPRLPTQPKQRGVTPSFQWTGDSGGSPAAKRGCARVGFAGMEDWFSAPVLPLEPCEYWLHEDCGIWSAGVFLVKGKVYGLEEAVRAAEETTCSACGDPGATLGCFFKSCPNKYHFRCTLEADCVLIEDNFSMKCKKHKNKTFKAPAGKRREDT